MYDEYPIYHKITYGDTLYKLAETYNTTVEDILNMNPHTNPYNLLIGEFITIVPRNNTDISYVPQQQDEIYIPETDFSNMFTHSISNNEYDLNKKMRLAWANHSYWDRFVMVSIVNSLKNTDSTVSRTLKTAEEISNLFTAYYGSQISSTLDKLLKEHISIAGDLIKASKDNDVANVTKLNKIWYDNADKMSEEFSRINPYYDKESTRKMLYKHLDLLKEQLANMLASKYSEDIQSSDKVVSEAMMMADYFVDGIVKQFPDMFKM